jgi:hypothetical protein
VQGGEAPSGEGTHPRVRRSAGRLAGIRPLGPRPSFSRGRVGRARGKRGSPSRVRVEGLRVGGPRAREKGATSRHPAHRRTE